MISKTGNQRKFLSRLLSHKGFTFIEVMVALILFSVGIVAIFKSFLISLDRMEYLTDRLYATTLLDNRIEKVGRMLRVYKALPSDVQRFDRIDVGSRKLNFEQILYVKDVEDFTDVFKIDVVLKWTQNRRPMKMTRASYISDFAENAKK